MLSIIILSWNVKNLLRRCLRSVFDKTNDIDFEVFVIDNASSDGSADMVGKEFPKAKLIRNDDNKGFAKANNQAIKLCHGEQIILLNPDTEILDSALAKMVRFLNEHPKAGIVGARLLNLDKTLQVGTARRFPTIGILTTMMLGLHSFLLKKKKYKDYYMLDEKFEHITEVDQVMGASLMAKREVFSKIGALDEKFWIWFEEVDFCKRAKNAEYKVFVLPDAEIIHHKGKSFIQQPKLKKYFQLSKSIIHYASKHFSKFNFIILILLWPLGFLQAALVQILGIKPR
ncbi:MAG: hypothetical protein ACD_63C00165G0002 [uncultured bacterium]|nr:MAG: hypothetical protein ACD_63C00165G0002 [uncultured bacterium]